MDWQPIATSPKDGTNVFIFRHGWNECPLAWWGEYPDNPVVNETDEDVWMSGWIFESYLPCYGAEEGFLGWLEDPMPTHWMPLPAPPEAN